MIRVAFLDDHATVRAGLEAIAAREPDLQSVGAAADPGELTALIRRSRPDVVVLDLDHPGESGLQLVLRIRRDPVAPAVVVHSGRRSHELTVAAALARADAYVSKDQTSDALLEAIRDVARGQHPAQDPPPDARARAAAGLHPTDRAILAMRLAGTPMAGVAQVTGLSVRGLAERIAGIVAQLTTDAIRPLTAATDDPPGLFRPRVVAFLPSRAARS